jgi:hypothetical protein
MRTISAVPLVGALLAAPCAYAQQKTQEHGGFVSIVAGSQAISAMSTTSEFDLVGNRVTVHTSRRHTTAPLVDVAGAQTIRRHDAAGAAFLRTATKQLMTWDATNPQSPTGLPPLRFQDVYRDATHKETQLHFSALWIAALNNKAAIDFSAGPSVFFVTHDSIAAITGPPLLGFAVVSRDSDTTLGYHAGFGFRGLLLKRTALRVAIRYARATADLSTGPHKVGGLQVGAGAAFVF